MVNIHRTVSGFGISVELETKYYCMPLSIVHIKYNRGDGVKKCTANIGADRDGRMVIKTKNPIPKVIQAYIKQHFFTAEFITKWGKFNNPLTQNKK